MRFFLVKDCYDDAEGGYSDPYVAVEGRGVIYGLTEEGEFDFRFKHIESFVDSGFVEKLERGIADEILRSFAHMRHVHDREELKNVSITEINNAGKKLSTEKVEYPSISPESLRPGDMARFSCGIEGEVRYAETLESGNYLIALKCCSVSESFEFSPRGEFVGSAQYGTGWRLIPYKVSCDTADK